MFFCLLVWLICCCFSYSLALIPCQFLLDQSHTCCSRSLPREWKRVSLFFPFLAASFLSTSKIISKLQTAGGLKSSVDNLMHNDCREVIAELKAAGASWIQFDEPTLVLDLDAHKLAAFSAAYTELESALSGLNVLVETYFADVPAESFKYVIKSLVHLVHNYCCFHSHLCYDIANCSFSCRTLTSLSSATAYGFDLVRGTQTVELIKSGFPAGKYLFAGVVDGRNIWADDLAASLSTLQALEAVVGKGKDASIAYYKVGFSYNWQYLIMTTFCPDKLVVSTSCSLMHTAVDLVNETKLDSEIKSWLAFAAQKVVEVDALAKALAGQKDEVWLFFSLLSVLFTVPVFLFATYKIM